jgi:V8-like Glu-specific endopeptidase
MGVTGTDPGGNPPVATNAYPYVGRVQVESTNPSQHFGTGSVIATAALPTGKMVLTAAHCINTTITPGGSFDVQRFERFTLPGGAQLYGLGVQPPGFTVTGGVRPDDIGLILLLNAPAGLPTAPLATPAQSAALAVGDPIRFLGFTGSMPGGDPLLGTTVIQSLETPVIRMDAAPDYHYIEAGDSGGPSLRNFGTPAAPDWRVISVHRSSVNGVPPDFQDISINAHAGFLNGEGVGGVRTFTTLAADTGDLGWSLAGRGRDGAASTRAAGRRPSRRRSRATS